MNNDLHVYFESCSRSAPDWIEKGKGLLIVADIINQELLSIFNDYGPCPPDEIQPKSIGLMDALMLLLGFSLENAIKGYMVSHKPDYHNISELKQYNYNASGGHGIHKMITSNMQDINQIEEEFLHRIEQALRWAGRYKSPKKYNKNENKITGIHPELNTMDYQHGKQLFEKIEKSTIELWDKNEALYYKWLELNR